MNNDDVEQDFPTTLTLEPCKCGQLTCQTVGFEEGMFYQGSGFKKPLAEEVKRRYDSYKSMATTIAAQREVIEVLTKAATPLVYFIEQYDRNPIRTADDFYGIHTGTEWEASLRLSDLRALRAALAKGMAKQ